MKEVIVIKVRKILEEYLAQGAAAAVAEEVAEEVAGRLEELATDVATISDALESIKTALETKTRRGRGRPKGSKNKTTKQPAEKAESSKRRGRPKKTKVVEPPVDDEDEDLLEDEDLEDEE